MTFRKDPSTDFQILSSPRDRRFISELHSSPYKLQKHEIRDFYHIVLSHLRKRLHTRTGNAILLSICKSLFEKSRFEVFQQENFIDQLPFAQKEYRSQLLDLLNILVRNIPEAFNEKIASELAPLSEREPRKVLTIIALFTEKFDEVSDPFPMVDILFRNSEAFRAIECADDYVSLLVWLMANKKIFRIKRNKHCWTYICDMLNLTNVAILNTCYYALCAIADLDKDEIVDCGYPVGAVSRDIKRQPVQAASWSLLMKYPPSSETRKMEDILNSLLCAANEDERASLILMCLAADGVNALHLLQNPQWMRRGLPGSYDTMRLFCIILMHTDLRQIIVGIPETIDLLRGLLCSNSVGMTSAICTIIRKLPLSKEFTNTLSQSGFLGIYFSSILESEDPDILLSALRLLDALSQICYVQEMKEMVGVVTKLIKESNVLSYAAASVAVGLCRHKECALLFQQDNLHEFFRKQGSDAKMKKYADKFLLVFAKHVRTQN